jgi:hypothetical protein
VPLPEQYFSMTKYVVENTYVKSDTKLVSKQCLDLSLALRHLTRPGTDILATQEEDIKGQLKFMMLDILSAKQKAIDELINCDF